MKNNSHNLNNYPFTQMTMNDYSCLNIITTFTFYVSVF